MKLIIRYEKELEELDYVDRAEDKVRLKGARLANFRKNPVVLMAHDYNCSSVCECFGYVPEGTYYKYKISRFVCMHSEFNNKKTGHKIINKKYVVCGKVPIWCPFKLGITNMEINKIYCGDCLEVMLGISDKSIDMILCDLPYGTTACKWDIIIPFEPLWKEYKRIIKDNGAIVLFGSQPFTSMLIMSNLKMFKYEIIWNKVAVTNPMLAKKQFMRCHENILVFYKKQPTYNPIIEEGKKWHRGGKKEHRTETLSKSILYKGSDKNKMRYPKDILTFSNANKMNNLHPTQKPIALFEYLIKTYTNEGDTVLDNCAGSGTTGVACKNLRRDYILIEKGRKYVEIARRRIKAIPELLF